MTKNHAITSIVIGILCGFWAGIAPEISLSIWAGFAACTAFFASGRHKLDGLAITITTTLVGVAIALLMIEGSDVIGAPLGTAISVGILVTVIVMLGVLKFLAFIPGMFVGCYSTFAIDADWQLLGASLLAGAVLGMLCDSAADLAVAKLGSPQTQPTATVEV